jgi:conjugative transfer signal peptidase TraF
MRKTRNILAGIVLSVSAGIFLLSIVFRLTGIYYNNTPSFPVGFYKIVDEPVGKGAYVSFCPPQDEVFDMAVARHYISTGNCPGGYGMLLKRVFAQGETLFLSVGQGLRLTVNCCLTVRRSARILMVMKCRNIV